MMNKWDDYFIQVAQATAQLSYAKRLKVGAVATRHNRIILCGYNGTPEGWDNCCEDEHNKTLPSVLHAEENLIVYAAKQGISLDQASLYITHSPCIQCAKLIYGAGIKKIEYITEYRSSEGIQFLKDCSVQVIQYSFLRNRL